MGWRTKVSSGALACAALVASAGISSAGEHFTYASIAREQAVYEAVGATTRAPIGWTEFCVEYKPECNTKSSTPRDVVLTPKAWADMVKVNAWVNDNIKPVTDL
jgi:predicted transglutaminase-like cysteine proteinase